MAELVNKIQVVVLAAGHGKRMARADLPKVLVPFRGKPMIMHLLESIRQSGVCDKPVIVVGQKADQVKQALGSGYTYVFQTEQLGTGHAVAATRSNLEGRVENLMVLYGDHPLVNPITIRRLVQAHAEAGTAITMATVKVQDFSGWRKAFGIFSRVIRGPGGKLIGTVESRDATPEQLAITEVNPAYFCFRAAWLWQNLSLISNNNAQHEYYLTDLVALARQQNKEITTINIGEHEALGVNTAEQLSLIEYM